MSSQLRNGERIPSKSIRLGMDVDEKNLDTDRYRSDETELLDDVHDITFRTDVLPEDPEYIRKLVAVTGFFSDEEVKVAGELAEEHLKTGPQSGYFFLFAEQYGRMVGYACYGPVPMTESSFDLYWIAVHPDLRRRGVGRRLLKECEKKIREAGGARIYVETSGRVQYASTHAFYEDMGYQKEAVLADFYRPGDSKVVYCKRLGKS